MTSLTRMPRVNLLVATAVIILIAELFANAIVLGDEGDASVGGWIGLSLFGIALTAVLGFGIGAVVFCVVFWSAIPFALGAAAIAAAGPGDDSPEGMEWAPSTTGVLLGVLAIIAAFILCLVG